MSGRYVRELDSLEALYRQGKRLSHAVVQGLDLRGLEVDWDEVRCEGTVFLGCRFPEGVSTASPWTTPCTSSWKAASNATGARRWSG